MVVSLGSVTGIPHEDYSNFSLNPTVMIIIAIIVLGYFYFFYGSARSPPEYMPGVSPPSTGTSGNYLFLIIAGVFLAVVILNVAIYMLDINVKAGIQGLFTREPTVNFDVDPGGLDGLDPNSGGGGGGDGKVPVPESIFTEEVYHIPGNHYTYSNAKAICKAYGGKLATVKQMQDAYNSGASWCSYGWSDDQMALYPTQYSNWETLRKIKGHEHDCGRPGLNGGFIANPNVKFGVNCYGHKPDITPEERKDMQTDPEYPKSKEDIEEERRVEYWRERIPSIKVSPFNHDNWNQLF